MLVPITYFSQRSLAQRVINIVQLKDGFGVVHFRKDIKQEQTPMLWRMLSPWIAL